MGSHLSCCHHPPETNEELIDCATKSDTPAASAYKLNHTKMHPSIKRLYIEFLKKTSEDITTIDLQNEILSDIDCECLSKLIPELKNLTEFILVNNELGLTGTNYLTDHTSTMTKLEKLVLSQNKLNDQCLEMICPTLPFLMNLKTLDLSRNEISDKGALMLAELVPGLDSLEVVDLSDNKIGNKGMVEVANQFKSLPGARRLLVVGNNLTDKTLKQLQKMFPNSEEDS